MSQFFATPLELLHEAEIGIALTVGGWILMFPVRTLIKKANEILDSFDNKLLGIQEELSTQRTNCLATLQVSSQKQVDLLEKAVDVLEAMHISQAEMSGYIKANHEKSL